MAVHYLCPKTKNEPTVIPVSILEMPAGYATAKGSWFFTHSNIPRLMEALQLVVNEIPFWCGRVRYVKHKTKGSIYERYKGLEVVYGFDNDPGCEVEVIDYPKTFQQVKITSDTGAENVYLPIDIHEFIPDDTDPTSEGIQGLRIKITKFKCGIVCLGLSSPHCLADATSLQSLISRWSAIYNNQNDTAMTLKYSPREIDSYALSPRTKDPSFLRQTQRVKRLVYDAWAATDKDVPEEFLPMTKGIDELITIEPLMVDRPLKISFHKPVCCKFYFSAIEITNMYQAIKSMGVEVSHMTGLIAHFWTCVNKVRGIDGPSRLAINLGLRNRLSRTNSFANYVGNFAHNFGIESHGRATIFENAQSVKDVIISVNEDTLPGHMYMLSRTACPSRYRSCCLDDTFLLVSTWVSPYNRNEVSFGGKLVHFDRDSMPLYSFALITSAKVESGIGAKWYDEGAFVYFSTSQLTLDKLMIDPMLRYFA